MNSYEITFKDEKNIKKTHTVEALTFPEAAFFAYGIRAKSNFSYEIISIGKIN